jgi:hypothetical protein
VEVPGPTQYRLLPDELLIDCKEDFVAPATNGDLLNQWVLLQLAIDECQARINAIKLINDAELLMENDDDR